MELKDIKFSVLLSIYYKENPLFLTKSLDSVFNQTLKPTEVILVEDGKLTSELDKVINEFEKKYNTLKVIKFEQNRGLGYALNDGLNACSYNYVFRMDTDDISKNDRFEKQLKYMLDNPSIDVLGTNIYEFKDDLNEDMRVKKMPIKEEVNKYILRRNPVNHMTVCFKKDSVLECGGYQPMLYLEDYYLWIRMYKNGKKIDNLNEELVYARIGNGFEKRRGNKKQIKGWKELQKYMLDNNMITKKMYKSNINRMRLLVYCPNFIRKIAYKLFLRRS